MNITRVYIFNVKTIFAYYLHTKWQFHNFQRRAHIMTS